MEEESISKRSVDNGTKDEEGKGLISQPRFAFDP